MLRLEAVPGPRQASNLTVAPPYLSPLGARISGRTYAASGDTLGCHTDGVVALVAESNIVNGFQLFVSGDIRRVLSSPQTETMHRNSA